MHGVGTFMLLTVKNLLFQTFSSSRTSLWLMKLWLEQRTSSKTLIDFFLPIQTQKYMNQLHNRDLLSIFFHAWLFKNVIKRSADRIGTRGHFYKIHYYRIPIRNGRFCHRIALSSPRFLTIRCPWLIAYMHSPSFYFFCILQAEQLYLVHATFKD